MKSTEDSDTPADAAAIFRRRRLRVVSLLAMLVVLAFVLRIAVYKDDGLAPVRVATTGDTTGAAGLRFALLPAPRPLPSIQFMDETGRRLTSEDFRGKVVLLNFWATWCLPCREEMPALDRLQATLGGKDFEVVAVSIDKGDKGPAALKVFYRDVGIRHLRIYHDPTGDAGFEVGMVGIPTTLLLDREGKELGRMSGPAKWDGPEALALIERHVRPPGAAGRNAR